MAALQRFRARLGQPDRRRKRANSDSAWQPMRQPLTQRPSAAWQAPTGCARRPIHQSAQAQPGSHAAALRSTPHAPHAPAPHLTPPEDGAALDELLDEGGPSGELDYSLRVGV
jgi:hypothetical protein